jgi:hypothetical protein
MEVQRRNYIDEITGKNHIDIMLASGLISESVRL